MGDASSTQSSVCNGHAPAGEAVTRVAVASRRRLFAECLGKFLHEAAMPAIPIIVADDDDVDVDRDIVVLDVGTQTDDLATAAKELARQAPLLLLGPRASAIRQLAEDAGAAGWVHYDDEPDALVDAIARVGRGERVNGNGPPAGRRTRRQDSLLDGLTRRERQTLALVGEGLSTSEIGQRLGISPNTARTHVQNLTGKLGVSSRLEAVAVAAEANGAARSARTARRAHDDAPRSRSAQVAIAGGEPIWRAALAAGVEAGGTTVVTVSKSDGIPAAIERSGAGSVILAPGAPSESIDLCSELKSVCGGLRLVVVENPDAESFLRDAMTAGADGYIDLEAGCAELQASVASVHRGEAFVPPRLLGQLLRELIEQRREEDDAVGRFARLSARERDVLRLLTQGEDHHQIAGKLYVSPSTARTHIQNVISKLGVHSRIDAVTLTTRHDLLSRFHDDTEATDGA